MISMKMRCGTAAEILHACDVDLAYAQIVALQLEYAETLTFIAHY